MSTQIDQDKMADAYAEFFKTINAKTRRYLHNTANWQTIYAKIVELAGGNENKLLETGAWVTAWAVCQAEGTLQEPPIDPEALKQNWKNGIGKQGTQPRRAVICPTTNEISWRPKLNKTFR